MAIVLIHSNPEYNFGLRCEIKKSFAEAETAMCNELAFVMGISDKNLKTTKDFTEVKSEFSFTITKSKAKCEQENGVYSWLIVDVGPTLEEMQYVFAIRDISKAIKDLGKNDYSKDDISKIANDYIHNFDYNSSVNEQIIESINRFDKTR